MKSSKKDGTSAQILQLIDELGPMTQAELRELTGKSKSSISALVRCMNKKTKTMPKRLYIIRWIYDAERERDYPRAVYALGSKTDCKKPRQTETQIKRRYRQKKKLRSLNSVWAMAANQPWRIAA